MSQSQAIKAVYEPIRSLAFGSIGVSYAGIGTEFDNPARIIRVQNLTDALLWFSVDGLNDHEVLAPNSFLLIDVNSNKSREQGYYFPEGTRFYVKQNAVPTEGSVYVSVIYGSIT